MFNTVKNFVDGMFQNRMAKTANRKSRRKLKARRSRNTEFQRLESRELMAGFESVFSPAAIFALNQVIQQQQDLTPAAGAFSSIDSNFQLNSSDPSPTVQSLNFSIGGNNITVPFFVPVPQAPTSVDFASISTPIDPSTVDAFLAGTDNASNGGDVDPLILATPTPENLGFLPPSSHFAPADNSVSTSGSDPSTATPETEPRILVTPTPENIDFLPSPSLFVPVSKESDATESDATESDATETGNGKVSDAENSNADQDPRILVTPMPVNTNVLPVDEVFGEMGKDEKQSTNDFEVDEPRILVTPIPGLINLLPPVEVDQPIDPRVLVTPMPGNLDFLPPDSAFAGSGSDSSAPTGKERDFGEPNNDGPVILITPMPGNLTFLPPVRGETPIGTSNSNDRPVSIPIDNSNSTNDDEKSDSDNTSGDTADSNSDEASTEGKKPTPDEIRATVEQIETAQERDALLDDLNDADALDAEAAGLNNFAQGQLDRADEFEKLGQQDAADRAKRNAQDAQDLAGTKRGRAAEIRQMVCDTLEELRQAQDAANTPLPDVPSSESTPTPPSDSPALPSLPLPSEQGESENNNSFIPLLPLINLGDDAIQQFLEFLRENNVPEILIENLPTISLSNDAISELHESLNNSRILQGLSIFLSLFSELKNNNNPTVGGRTATITFVTGLEVVKMNVPVLNLFSAISAAFDLGFAAIDKAADHILGANDPDANNGIGLFEIVPAGIRSKIANYEAYYQFLTGQKVTALDDSFTRVKRNGGALGIFYEISEAAAKDFRAGNTEASDALLESVKKGERGRGVQYLLLHSILIDVIRENVSFTKLNDVIEGSAKS